MKMLYKFVRSLLGMFISTAVGAGVIIGDDDRKDVYEIQDQKIREMAKSTAALIKKQNLEKLEDGRYKLKGLQLSKTYRLCEDEKFSDESLIANCSASLIADNKILTAAHCVERKDHTPGNMGMKDYYIVFNYHKLTPGQTEFIVNANDVYELKKEIFHDFNMSTAVDLAVYELDRPADKAPLKYSRNDKSDVGTPLFMLGHPYGISLKLSDNSAITEVMAKRHTFRNHLDAFSVNSGSAIFNADSMEIIGVLVRGTGQNITNRGRECKEWDRGDAANHYMEGNYLWSLPKNLN
jgi:V8-like Glu-specific endopeptidase